MIKNVMNISLTDYELTALLKQILNHRTFSLYYKFESSSNLGVSYSTEVEDVNYYKNTLDFSYKNNGENFTIFIPQNLTKDIKCKIEHSIFEEVDYDKLTESEKTDYLYDQLVEDTIKYKKRNRNDFGILFDNFRININDFDDSVFYSIIANLNQHTNEYKNYLAEMNEMDNKVDIDGFWESIDNAIEK